MKRYLDQTVWEAAQDRIAYLFKEYDNLLVAFSGGKDSGVLLNLAYQYAKEHCLENKLSMYHLDYEAQYQMTTDYVTETFAAMPINRFWCCVPIGAQCAVSMSGKGRWIPWQKQKQDLWVRQLPSVPYLITEDNCGFVFDEGLEDYQWQSKFCQWFADEHHGKTAVLVGIRADESLSRYHATCHEYQKKEQTGKTWITVTSDNCHNVYPIWDWTVDDIWIANARNNWTYNKLYDLYYQAGLTLDQMRVASPFNDCAIDTLKLYKVIDPANWGRMIGRIDGVNFAGLYGGTTAMGWRDIKLPKGHTWKSYAYFLLDTLPDDLREHYEKILATSLKFWCETGGYLTSEQLAALDEKPMPMPGKSRYPNLEHVRFEKYPDDVDLPGFKDYPSYKRFCVCILKNDYYCKYMGFAPTKQAVAKRKAALEKYRSL